MYDRSRRNFVIVIVVVVVGIVVVVGFGDVFCPVLEDNTNLNQYRDHARAYAYEDCTATTRTEHKRDPSSPLGAP